MRNERKGVFVFISVIALLFTAACIDHANAADFKSEDELIDETRANVERHLNDKWRASSPAAEDKPATVEAPAAVTVEELLTKKDTIAETHTEPVVKEEISQNKQAEAEKAPGAKDRPAVQNSPAVQDPPQVVKKEEVPPDVIQIDPAGNYETKSDKESVGEDVEFVSGIQEPVQIKPLIAPVLKRTDINKIGSNPYYETYEGLRLLKYFTVAQRVEIYQEPRPIDSYIMDAFYMNKNYGYDWYHDVNYRSQILPIFTRAYGTEITMSNPKNKEGQIRYTHDYREMYGNDYPKWPQIKWEHWDQNEVLLMHSKQLEPIGWNYTSNLGYRYSTMIAKGDIPYYEVRQLYFGSLSLAPNEKLEWFGQAEYYKSKHVKCSWAYNPDHFLGRTELRIRSNDMKTMYVPSFSYSKDYYYPFADTYQKYEIQFRVGRDFTKRFSVSSTIKYHMDLRDTPDNNSLSLGNAFKDKAYVTSWENRFSYNVYDRLYLQAGLDLSNGLNLAAFDNWGMLAGLEYYAPGMIRVDFGWRGNHYYNIDDFLSTIYFKFYLFM